MVCQKCGANLPEGSNFCTSCGTKVQGKNTVSPSVKKRHKIRIILVTFLSVAAGIFCVIFFYNVNSYQNYMMKAGNYYKDANYKSAKTNYQKALGFFNNETAKKRIAECNIKIKEEDSRKDYFDLVNTVEIYEIYTYDSDTITGTDITITWKNKTDKKIKQINFTATPCLNLSGEVKEQSDLKKVFKADGPFEDDEYNDSDFSNAWKSKNITDIKLNDVEVIYTDGSKAAIHPNMIFHVAED